MFCCYCVGVQAESGFYIYIFPWRSRMDHIKSIFKSLLFVHYSRTLST